VIARALPLAEHTAMREAELGPLFEAELAREAEAFLAAHDTLREVRSLKASAKSARDDEEWEEAAAHWQSLIDEPRNRRVLPYVELAKILSDVDGIAALELNISCPNIKEGGITFGCSVHGTADVVRAVRAATALPVIPKLTPNVTDISAIARAAEDAGADAVSLVNTFLAMAIDVETRRPRLSNIVGGLSGPAIRPIAVRMVYECRQAIRIPIIGMGGIATTADALEFIIAGASAVQVGTANFADPLIWPKLLKGLEAYLERHRIARISELTGTIDTTARDKEWISS